MIPSLLALTEEMSGLSELCPHPTLQGDDTTVVMTRRDSGISDCTFGPASHGSVSCSQSFMDLKCSSQHTGEKIPGTPYKWLIHFLFLVLLTSGCVCEACSACVFYALMKMFTLYWLLWWHLIAKGHPTVIKETMPRNKRLGQPVLLQSPVTTLQRQEHLSPQARLEPYCPFPCRCALSECAVSQICTGGRWITSVTSVLELE